MRAAFFAATVSLAAPAVASDFRLGLPIDCTLGSDCYVQQFVDRDPGDGHQDFACGPLTYDGHKGTDFALIDLKAMQAGVDVIAMADGRVTGLRDGVADSGIGPDTQGRECGNGVVVEHAEGFTTQYCHLKQGPLTVKIGDQVTTGDALGQVGYSGSTEFPHVHVTLRQDGRVIDPFDPSHSDDCGSNETLWQAAIPYRPGGILSLGFAAGIPEYSDIKAGTAALDTVPTDAPALVIWAFGFGARAGDEIRLLLSGSEGVISDQTVVMDRNQAQFFRASGRKKRGNGWPEGTYEGLVQLMRDGVTLEERTARIQTR